MRGIIAITVRLIQAGKRVYARKWSFLFVFAVIFIASIWILAALDLLPDAKAKAVPTVTLSAASVESAVASTSVPVVASELPVKVSIPIINLNVTVSNPTSTNIEILDNALLSGAARYPTSAKLGEDGNVVIFGHSSYLPIVNNQAFKTFDGIQKLVAGNVVTVYSADTAYTYRVRTVTKENATTAGIPLQVSGKVLTLATCDSFGEKSDRFVVVADFVDSYSISN